MKTQFKILFSVAVFLLMGLVAMAQSGTTEEVPGDNFSLEGALELFKKSASPQEFEQLLNSADSKVNNLDLNGDGEIDYIRVTDKTEGNIHDFILSAVVSANESQDVAVIELEKRNDGTAVLQIVGDADIYGVETIIEPTSEVRVNAGTTTARTTVNVWTWPSVQYVYGPYYNPWMSPWGWGYYANWYRPWRPIVWSTWYPYWTPYRPYYAMCYRHRIGYAAAIYRPYRTTSVIVYNRNYTQIHNFRNTSRSYQYNRGGYAHNNRYDNEHRWSNGNNNNGGRSSNGYNSGRTRSDYNTRTRSDYNSNTRSDYRSNNGRTNSNSNNDVSVNRGRSFSSPNTGGSRTRTFSSPNTNTGGSRTFSSPNTNNGGSRTFSSPHTGSRTFSSPSTGGGRSFGGSHTGGGGSSRSFSSPSHSSGGGSGGSGGGHHRGH